MRKLTAGVWVALSLSCAWTVVAQAAATEPQVVVEGSRHAGDRVRAGGHAVSLLRALEQIVPPSYSVNVPNAGAWADAPVSWRGDQSFVQALGDVLASNRSLQARINTDLHLVTVSVVAPLSGQPIPRELEPEMQPVVPVDTSTSRATAVASAAPPWSVSSGYTAPVRTATAPIAANAPRPYVAARALSQPQTSLQTQQPIQQQVQQRVPVQIQTAAPAMQRVAALPAVQAQPMPLSVDVSAQATGLAPTPIPAAAAAPVADDMDSGVTVWDLRQSDGSVRNALARWAKEAGWQFIWAVPTDFSIDATASIHGTFEQALNSVVDALSHSDVPIQALMYRGNHVLRITAKGAG